MHSVRNNLPVESNARSSGLTLSSGSYDERISSSLVSTFRRESVLPYAEALYSSPSGPQRSPFAPGRLRGKVARRSRQPLVAWSTNRIYMTSN